jgi:HK97 family phage major capsid protein
MDDIEKQQGAIADMQKRMAALQTSYNALQDSQKANLTPVASMPAEPKSRKEMRASNEYARAFCYAIRNGISPRKGRGDEKCKILYDAMTEGGGDPAGEDGGFLVPIDIDNTIRELRRELNPLAPLFSEEIVTAPTGWRVIDTAPTSGFTAVDELGTVPSDDQPAFAKVGYSLAKYGLILPISNELMKDEDANLMAYISRWGAKKLVLTENGILITLLKTLAASALVTGTETPCPP